MVATVLCIPMSNAQGIYVLTNTCHFVLFIAVTRMSNKDRLIMVSVCISLMISDTKHLFMDFLVIVISFLEKCQLDSFAYFFNGVVGWLLLSCQEYVFPPVFQIYKSPCNSL